MENFFPGLSHEFRDEELPSELQKVCEALGTYVIKQSIWIKSDDGFEGKYGDYYPQIGLLVQTEDVKINRVLK